MFYSGYWKKHNSELFATYWLKSVHIYPGPHWAYQLKVSCIISAAHKKGISELLQAVGIQLLFWQE